MFCRACFTFYSIPDRDNKVWTPFAVTHLHPRPTSYMSKTLYSIYLVLFIKFIISKDCRLSIVAYWRTKTCTKRKSQKVMVDRIMVAMILLSSSSSDWEELLWEERSSWYLHDEMLLGCNHLMCCRHPSFCWLVERLDGSYNFQTCLWERYTKPHKKDSHP